MYSNLRKKLSEMPYFTSVMASQLGETKENTMAQWLSRRLMRGEILRIKRDVYMTKDYYLSHRNEVGFLAVVSNLIEPNSYLTEAWILQNHEVLSESVFSVTAITSKHAKLITNVLASFTYSHVKKEIFTGYHKVWNGPLYGYEATLAKAMFDYFYMKVANVNLSSKKYNLIEDERLNMDLWTAVEQEEFDKYVSLVKSPKMGLIANQLRRAI